MKKSLIGDQLLDETEIRMHKNIRSEFYNKTPSLFNCKIYHHK